MRSFPKVKQISFKEREYQMLLKHQEDLMDLYKLDISGLYKTLLREKHKEVFGAPMRSNQEKNNTQSNITIGSR